MQTEVIVYHLIKANYYIRFSGENPENVNKIFGSKFEDNYENNKKRLLEMYNSQNGENLSFTPDNKKILQKQLSEFFVNKMRDIILEFGNRLNSQLDIVQYINHLITNCYSKACGILDFDNEFYVFHHILFTKGFKRLSILKHLLDGFKKENGERILCSNRNEGNSVQLTIGHNVYLNNYYVLLAIYYFCIDCQIFSNGNHRTFYVLFNLIIQYKRYGMLHSNFHVQDYLVEQSRFNFIYQDQRHIETLNSYVVKLRSENIFVNFLTPYLNKYNPGDDLKRYASFFSTYCNKLIKYIKTSTGSINYDDPKYTIYKLIVIMSDMDAFSLSEETGGLHIVKGGFVKHGSNSYRKRRPSKKSRKPKYKMSKKRNNK